MSKRRSSQKYLTTREIEAALEEERLSQKNPFLPGYYNEDDSEEDDEYWEQEDDFWDDDDEEDFFENC